ncbi:MAG: OmpA family protein, partial [Chitinophagaceae bacterium]
MKKVLTFLIAAACIEPVVAQPSASDTGGLKEQKQNIITASTVLKVENLGININSDLPELRPTISADGNLLFFITENHPANTKFSSIPNSQDIWYSERDSTGKWSEARHLRDPINSVFYNAVYWVSPDKNRILIRGAFTEGGFEGKGVSMSYRRKNGRWSNPQMLQIRNYHKYDRGLQSGASMANDGQSLLFYMSPTPGSGTNDMFVSFLLADGTWSEPKSLGKKLNLPEYNEMTPYMASDGETLYFSSDRPGGLGENDIWMTRRLDKSWQKWSEPVNLGAPINTPDWDAFFTLDAGGEYAYLTTKTSGYGESDIVRVKLMEKEKPKPVLMITGNVWNQKTKQPLSASLIYETLPDGVEVGNAVSSEVDGSFKIVLPYDKN